ncbi:hypothetical protein [Halogranum rubrum]|uniref:Uncharacterized protein n=1 Tax=Halogranum salarium B-1 TaxID=1210908 RepID=J3A157_9EURY|nr:hypothetical protein [Halogranum salarium]EJN59058.1 hypothetical protein HSB1_24790 [Halogranum salarium B-1]
MNRRQFLALSGTGTLACSGCLSRISGIPESRRVSIGDSVVLGDTTLTVSAPTVQQSIIADPGVFRSVQQADDRQYVTVDVQTNSEVRATAAESDDEIRATDFHVKRSKDLTRPSNSGEETVRIAPVTRECSGVCLGIPIPAEPTKSAKIVYRPRDGPGASWALSEETTRLFAERPVCEWRETRVVEREGRTALEFSVENVGPRTAGYRVLVHRQSWNDQSDPVGFEIPVGETVTETVVPPILDGLDPASATLREGTAGSHDVWVEPRDATTPSSPTPVS